MEKIESRKRKDSNTSSPPPSKRKMTDQLEDNEDIPLVYNRKEICIGFLMEIRQSEL